MADDIDAAIEQLVQQVDAVAGDTGRFNQQDSIDVYKGVIAHCRDWIQVIHSEMDEDDG